MIKHQLKNKRGFTLLELLIVVAILAILGAVTLFVLNPAETLKKTRDSQRITDLGTIKSALALYLTSTSSPYVGATTTNPITTNGGCLNGGASVGSASGTVWYSLNSGLAKASSTYPNNGTGASTWGNATSATPYTTNGTGWIPANLDGLTGGSPISNLPVDPTNTIAGTANTTSTDLVYRYSCAVDNSTNRNIAGFEVDADLESAAYSGMSSTDGGDNSQLYEVGTQVKNLLPQSGF